MLTINTNYTLKPYDCNPINNHQQTNKVTYMQPDSVSFSGFKEKKYIENTAKKNPLLKIYLDDISRYPTLDKKQTTELFKKMEKGGKESEEAREKLIQANLRLVLFTIMKYCHNTPLPIMDCIQYGNIGLINAVDKFDYKKNGTFSSYAVENIKYKIYSSAYEQAKVIRIPKNRIAQINALKKAEERFTQVLNRFPSDKELAKYLGINVYEVKSLKHFDASSDFENLESVVYDRSKDGYSHQTRANFDTTSEELYLKRDAMQGESEQDFYENLEQRDIKRDIRAAIKTLKGDEKLVMEKWLKICDTVPDTLSEIGRLMGKTRMRIWYIDRAAFHKLRSPKVMKYLGEHSNRFE